MEFIDLVSDSLNPAGVLTAYWHVRTSGDPSRLMSERFRLESPAGPTGARAFLRQSRADLLQAPLKCYELSRLQVFRPFPPHHWRDSPTIEVLQKCTAGYRVGYDDVVVASQ